MEYYILFANICAKIYILINIKVITVVLLTKNIPIVIVSNAVCQKPF